MSKTTRGLSLALTAAILAAGFAAVTSTPAFAGDEGVELYNTTPPAAQGAAGAGEKEKEKKKHLPGGGGTTTKGGGSEVSIDKGIEIRDKLGGTPAGVWIVLVISVLTLGLALVAMIFAILGNAKAKKANETIDKLWEKVKD